METETRVRPRYLAPRRIPRLRPSGAMIELGMAFPVIPTPLKTKPLTLVWEHKLVSNRVDRHTQRQMQ